MSFSETQTGGQRNETQPFVSFRRPPKWRSENEADFGFSCFDEHSSFSFRGASNFPLLPVYFLRVLLLKKWKSYKSVPISSEFGGGPHIQNYPADCYGGDELSLQEDGARRAEEHPSSRQQL